MQAFFLSIVLLSNFLLICCLRNPSVFGSHQLEAAFRASEENKCNRNVDIHETISEPPVTNQNRGKPLHCTYRIRIRPERNDWMVFLRFTRFKVGEVSPDRKRCIGGYLSVIDGYKDSNSSQHTNLGYFCGEIDMPKTLISETPYVRIIFHAESYDEGMYFQFSGNIQKREEHLSNLGQYHKFNKRRGRVVEGTYCDRIFEDCFPGHCYISSPGYPEAYLRNLRCRYLIKAKKGLIVLEGQDFNVDGEACEGFLACFARPVTTNPEECPYDFVRVYDGPDNQSPLIATFCGQGKLSTDVIASGSEMLVEFVSSPAGQIADTGFHLKTESKLIGQEATPIKMNRNGSCVIKKTIVEPNISYVFTSIKSWHPPNTTCSYLFNTPHPNDHISLEFLQFTTVRITYCKDNVQLFDGAEPDLEKMMNILCDTNKPSGGASKSVYVTSGPQLLVHFVSALGSLNGASINYKFQVKRIVPAKKVSAEDMSRNCSRIITPESLSSGIHSIHPEEFNKSIDGQITCNITFDASSLLHGRVNLSILSAFSPTLICGKYCDIGIIGHSQAKLIIHRSVDFSHFISPMCFCEPITSLLTFNFDSQPTPQNPQVINTVSNGSSLSVAIILPADWGQRKTSEPIEVMYRFFPEYRCGPESTLSTQVQGKLNFPFKPDTWREKMEAKDVKLNDSLLFPTHPHHHHLHQLEHSATPLFCKWTLQVLPDLDIAFNVYNLNLPFDCSNDDFLLLKDIPLCVQSAFTSNFVSFFNYYHIHHHYRHIQKHFTDLKDQKSFIIRREELRNGHELNLDSHPNPSYLNIYFSASNPVNSSFTLYWSHLKLLRIPEALESPESLITISKECEFLCKSSKTCLRRDLVCNGFPNCPNMGNGANFLHLAEDEVESICRQKNFFYNLFTNKMTWLVSGISVALLLLSLILCTFLRFKKARKKNNQFH